MTTYYIDAHCHLDLMANIQNKVLLEDSLPIKTVSVTNAPSFFKPNVALFQNSKNIRVALGLHPELSSQYGHQFVDLKTQLNATRYIGEIGLDGSARFKDSFTLQKQIFENILKELSLYNGKVLTIHTRNAAKETIDLLKNNRTYDNNKIILHWYSGDKNSLKEAIEIGCYFSINHKMLQSAKGVEIAKHIPKHLLLTETDAPFTFDSNIKTRIASLRLACELLSNNIGMKPNDLQILIYQNFKEMLS